MPTKTDIANKALARINVPSVLSIDGDDDQAEEANRAWDMVRNEVLREGIWNFARKRAALARLTETPAFEFSYYYALPADFISLVELNEIGVSEGGSEKFEIELASNNALALASDSETVKVTYVAEVEDTSVYDPLFIEALSIRLAAELSSTLTGSRSQYQDLLREYELAISRAKLADARDARGEGGKMRGFIEGSELVQSRFVGRSGYTTAADFVGLE